MMALLDQLARRELLVVSGKGGVGKSAVAAALARLLAERGRSVLLLEIDPRENAHQMLGIAPSDGEILAAGESLFLQNLQPRSVLDQVVREQLRVDLIARRVLDSPVYHHFAEGAPGLKELAVIGQVLRLLSGVEKQAPEIDLVILDAPATGHGVSLLAAPLLVSEVIHQGPFGRMTAKAAELVADAKRCGIVAVTQGEEMPVSEVLELDQMLQERIGRRVDLLVVNGLYPPLPEGANEVDDPSAELNLWQRRRSLNEREMRRLDRHWQGPVWRLPLLALDRGPLLITELARRLKAADTMGETA